ncbi:NlpC/P60 family protein [Kaarinaea lacus]
MKTRIATDQGKTRHLEAVFGISILIAIFLISGCSTPLKNNPTAVTQSPLFPGTTSHSKVQQELSRHFENWKRTPYRLGGTSRRGIDCSGFVQVTFRDVFDKKIPRSTELQRKAGHSVKRENLRLGDLVFFRTGRRQRHVGIYIGNNSFMHASTSRGVMLSKLNSPYWSQHYWMAKRILSS